MPNKGKAQTNAQATPKVVVCQFCNKKITKGTTIAQGHGARCAAMQKRFTTAAAMQTHYAKIRVAAMPAGFITVSSLHKVIVAKQHSIPGLTISKMVRAFGTDRAANPPANPIAQVYYMPNSHRVIHGWLGTAAGLQALATGQWGKAPTPPKVQTI